MPRVIHFEIHAQNPERMSQFYKTIFDWKFQQWPGMEFWMVETGPSTEPGINGGMMKAKSTESMNSINTVQVSNVDEYAEKVTKNGGTIVVPKMAIPGMGYLMYCKDPEGNIFGITHEDKNAK